LFNFDLDLAALKKTSSTMIKIPVSVAILFLVVMAVNVDCSKSTTPNNCTITFKGITYNWSSVGCYKTASPGNSTVFNILYANPYGSSAGQITLTTPASSGGVSPTSTGPGSIYLSLDSVYEDQKNAPINISGTTWTVKDTLSVMSIATAKQKSYMTCTCTCAQ
jgi:hypothetical protein